MQYPQYPQGYTTTQPYTPYAPPQTYMQNVVQDPYYGRPSHQAVVPGTATPASDYIDPYSENHDELNYNDYDSYIRPLKTREKLHLGEEQVEPGTGLNERGFAPKRSPVDIRGLRPISTSCVEEPSANPDDIKRQRELEERTFNIPHADPSALEPIHVSRESGGVDVRQIKNSRAADVNQLRLNEPPPEAIRCGWREYQGGATWQDITRYRDFELGQLKEQQREQQSARTGPVYYY